MSFEEYWVGNASKETWANKAVAANIWADKQAKQDKIDIVVKSIDSFFDNQVGTPTQREYCNFIAEIKQALRGEHD